MAGSSLDANVLFRAVNVNQMLCDTDELKPALPKRQFSTRQQSASSFVTVGVSDVHTGSPYGLPVNRHRITMDTVAGIAG